MSAKKDMRRPDLGKREPLSEWHRYCPNEHAVIPYKAPEKEDKDGDVASTMSSTLPMIAVCRTLKVQLQTIVLIYCRCLQGTSEPHCLLLLYGALLT